MDYNKGENFDKDCDLNDACNGAEESADLEKNDSIPPTRSLKHSKTEKDKKKRPFWLQFILDFAVVIVVTMVLTFLIKPTLVKGESMEPTLQNNNYLLASTQSYKFGSPKRGDIVIFPHKESDGKKKLYIKRVIGLPGDSVVVESGSVWINGKLKKESYIKEPTEGSPIRIVVPEKEVFVMGDNRNNSFDSRMFGTVPINKIEGKIFLRLYPLNKVKLF